MIVVSIDGACRGNGKPDCLSTGAAVFFNGEQFEIKQVAERPSTNQRGEMLGLIEALKYMTLLSKLTNEFYMVMDSEYLFNAISKDWIGNWRRKGWVTAENNSVKNKDLWEVIGNLLDELEDVEIYPYHIKGHLVSLGKVTAAKILKGNHGPSTLYKTLQLKYEQDRIRKPDNWDAALQLYERNNGHIPPEEIFKKFVVLNTVTDYIAGTLADDLNK